MAYENGHLQYPVDNSSTNNPAAGVCAAWTGLWVNRVLSDPSSLYWTKPRMAPDARAPMQPSAPFNRIVATQAQALYEDLRDRGIMLSSINQKLDLAETKWSDFVSLTVDANDIQLDLYEAYDEFMAIVQRLKSPLYASFGLGSAEFGHAVGFYNNRVNMAFYVFDPNKGLVRYRDLEDFRDDFIGLLAPGGLYEGYLGGMLTIASVSLRQR